MESSIAETSSTAKLQKLKAPQSMQIELLANSSSSIIGESKLDDSDNRKILKNSILKSKDKKSWSNVC